jgi:Tol biopolymer transport system component
VWVVHPDGTGMQEITSGSDGSISEFPDWSPDSTKLLFECTTKHGEAIWIVNSDGTGPYGLTDIPGHTGYAWGDGTGSRDIEKTRSVASQPILIPRTHGQRGPG